tara:strand:+ start:663 stop:854 length:192 start_codon:yes stop_codon:yes gene_type:complete
MPVPTIASLMWKMPRANVTLPPPLREHDAIAAEMVEAVAETVSVGHAAVPVGLQPVLVVMHEE